MAAGFNCDVRHTVDELGLVFLCANTARPGFDMVLRNGIRWVGGEELYGECFLLSVAQAVDVPVESAADLVRIFAAQLRIRAVAATQLPVVEEVEFVNLGNVARFQEFGIDMAKIALANE